MIDRILRRNNRYSERVAALLREMKNHPESRLNQKPASGGWSALQTAHHVMLAEERSLQYLHKKLSAPAHFNAAGLGARWRAFLLWASLSSPFKFKAPEPTNPENLPEQSSFAEVEQRWNAIRADWTRFFEQLPTELQDKAVYRHPRAGRLGWMQTLNFFETHLRRHRKQILRALQAEI